MRTKDEKNASALPLAIAAMMINVRDQLPGRQEAGEHAC